MLKGKSFLALYLTLLISIVVFGGCTSNSTRLQTEETQQQEQIAGKAETATLPVAGDKDEIVIALSGEPDTGFDPTLGWGRYGAPLFFSTLLRWDSDLNFAYDLADSYAVSDDALTYTFTIRSDAVFTDGEKVTAQDVAFTYMTAKESASDVDLTQLKEAVAKDDYTVVFTLESAQSTFLYTVASLGIVPEHVYGPDFASNPLGSGPWVMAQWDRGQQVIITANRQYYGEKPYIQKATILFLNVDAALAAVQTGEVDVAYTQEIMADASVPGMRLEVCQTIDNRGISFPYVASGEVDEQGYPVGNDVTSDAAIRKAIVLAIDRQKLVDEALNGYGTPAYSECDEMPWWNEENVFDDGKVDEAKAMLEQAGWIDEDGDGIREKNGLKAEFGLLYAAGDTTRQSLAAAAAEQVKAIGISMKVEGLSWDDIEKRMHSEAVLFGWGSQTPQEVFFLYDSVNRGKGYNNANFYSNPVVDAHIADAMTAISPDEANKHWQLAQFDGSTGYNMRADAPWAWLVNTTHLYFVKEGLSIGEQAIHPHGHNWPLLSNLETWRWTE